MNNRNFQLLQALDARNLTQGAFSRKIAISETRFTRIIRGYVTPTEREIERICKALKEEREELGLPKKNLGDLL